MGRLLPLALCSLPLAFTLGCGGSIGGPAANNPTQKPAELLENVKATLKDEKPSIASYQNAIQQLNVYLEQEPAVRQKMVPAEDHQKQVRELLLPPMGFLTDHLWTAFVDDWERLMPLEVTRRKERAAHLPEVQRKAFTLLDAHHLDGCLLFRDAAQALKDELINEPEKDSKRRNKYDADLGNEPGKASPHRAQFELDLARNAFGFVVRHVSLPAEPRGRADISAAPFRQALLPAHEVLRRGYGYEQRQDRTRVFFALLEQLGLDACMVARRTPDGDQLAPWIPGVLIDKQVYLFDTRLGLEVPGKAGQPATLAEVLADPSPLQALYSPDRSGDEAPEQSLARPVLLLHASLPALSARMRWLQDELVRDKHKNPVILFQDLAAQRQRFVAAAAALPDVEVRLRSVGVDDPSLVLARYVEVQRETHLLRRTDLEIRDPAEAKRIQELRTLLKKDPDRLRERNLNDSLVPRRLMPEWLHNLAKDLNDDAFYFDPESVRLYEHFTFLFRRVRTDAGGPHDLLVRGQPEAAIDRILNMQRRLDQNLDNLRRLPNVAGELSTNWANYLRQSSKQIEDLRSERDRLVKQNASAADVRKVDERLNKAQQIFEGAWKAQEGQMTGLAFQWAAPEMQEHLFYFMGLAKMEQARHAESGQLARLGLKDELTPIQHWDSAADWFRVYLTHIVPYAQNHWSAAAQFNLAWCRAAQARLAESRGDAQKRYAEAADLLEALEKSQPNLLQDYPEDSQRPAQVNRRYQRQANLYLIREWRKKSEK